MAVGDACVKMATAGKGGFFGFWGGARAVRPFLKMLPLKGELSRSD
jgi:hypothetical protein